MENKEMEKTEMNPIVVETLVAIGASVANRIMKYSDPNMQSIPKATVQQAFEEYIKRIPLPEKYDEGMVNEIMGKIDSWVDSIVKLGRRTE